MRLIVKGCVQLALGLALGCQVASPQQSSMPVAAVRITVDGFQPPVVSVKAGTVLLLTFDREPSMSTKAVSLDLQGGGHVTTIPFQLLTRNDSRYVTLSAGTYLLSEPSHPQWSGMIVARP